MKMDELHKVMFEYIQKNGGEFPGNPFWSRKFKEAYEKDIGLNNLKDLDFKKITIIKTEF